MADYGTKTLNEYDTFNPIRNLWRNVLIIGLEDLLKNKEKQAMRAAKSFSKEEIWFYSDDFKLICEYADIEPGMVKKRTFEAIERIRKKYAEKDMSKMPGQWLYKSKTISRKSYRGSSTMSAL